MLSPDSREVTSLPQWEPESRFKCFPAHGAQEQWAVPASVAALDRLVLLILSDI